MRNKVLTFQSDIVDIIRHCQWCHVAMVDPQGKPYVIPMNFGFRDDTIYLHGAQEGKKITILKNNPDVCIQFSTDHVLRWQSEQVACSWSMKYRSVIAYGKVEFIEDPDEKVAALHTVMAQFSDKVFKFNPPAIREVCVMKVKVDRFEGRAYGY